MEFEELPWQSMAGDLGKVLVDWNFPSNLHLLRGIPLKGQIVGLECPSGPPVVLVTV